MQQIRFSIFLTYCSYNIAIFHGNCDHTILLYFMVNVTIRYCYILWWLWPYNMTTFLGDPRCPLGYPEWPLGDPGWPLGDPRQPLGHPGQRLGDPGRLLCKPGQPLGDIERPLGDRGRPLGDPGWPLGDPGWPLCIQQSHLPNYIIIRWPSLKTSVDWSQ